MAELLVLEGADGELQAAERAFHSLESALRSWRFPERPEQTYDRGLRHLEQARPKLGPATRRLGERDRRAIDKLWRRAQRARERAENLTLQCANRVGIAPAHTHALLRGLFAAPAPRRTTPGNVTLRVTVAGLFATPGLLLMLFAAGWGGLLGVVAPATLVASAFIPRRRIRYPVTAIACVVVLGLPLLALMALASMTVC
jgi:hypothetical protein